LLNYLFLTLV